MTIIVEKDPINGMPSGIYDVFYYDIRGDRAIQQGGFDREVSHQIIIPKQQKELPHDEIAWAVCKSSPGGAWIYGSEASRKVAKANGLGTF